MLFSKNLNGIFMTSFWISCSTIFTLVSILCVHVSLWTYIFVIGVYLETYTHENSYILNWFSNSLVTTFYSFLTLWWFLKGTSFVCFLCVMLSHLNKLVELFAISPLVCEYGKDMICTMCNTS